MTRFSNDNDFIDPRTLVGQTDNTNPAFANNMGNTSVQPQFAEYVMPTAPGRVPSSASNFYASGAEAVSYGAQGNMSVQTADGGYAWAGNNPAHNMSFRERQMYHAQQEERQEALYYRATTPNYSNYNYPPDYSNYNYGPTYGPDYGADWNGQTTPLYTPAVAYQGDTGYIPPAPYPPAPYYPGQDGGNLASAAPAPDNTYQYGADGSPVAATPPGPDYSRTNANPGDAQVASAAPQGNSGGWTPYDFEVYNNLKEKAQELTGHCIQEYDKSVPVRLGCARAVSLLVTGGYGFDVKDQSVRGLEHT